MSIQVKEIAFVFHSITDVARARKFYEGLLNLKIALQVEVAPGKWWLEYDIAGQAFGISNAMPGNPSSALVLEVVDLDAAFTAAKAAGVTNADAVMDFPPCRMFVTKDPDGNEISLHQRKITS